LKRLLRRRWVFLKFEMVAAAAAGIQLAVTVENKFEI
jgi:hypothetical protein